MLNKIKAIFLSLILGSSLALAQPAPEPNIPLELKDEGTDQGPIDTLDCVGAGVSCTVSAGTGTLTVNGGSGSGTVSSVSVVTANGISGTVATATTTPAITLIPFLSRSGVNWGDLNKDISNRAINWEDVPSYATGKVLTATTSGGVDWETASGGGGNTIYTANDSLVSDRVVDLAGYSLEIKNGETGLTISPSSEISSLQAVDPTGSTNRGRLFTQADPSFGYAEMVVDYNDGTQLARIAANADPYKSVITHNATYHEFSSGTVGINKSYPDYPLDIYGNGINDFGYSQLRLATNSSEAGISLTNYSTGGRQYKILSTGDGSGVGGGKYVIGDATAGLSRFSIDANGQIAFNAYGGGTITGTPTYSLQVDSLGNIIEGSIGGGGNTIYTADDSLTSARAVSLAGNYLQFLGNNSTQITIDPNGYLNLVGSDSAGSYASINLDGYTADDASMNLIVYDSGSGLQVQQFYDATLGTIAYTAPNGHTFTGNVKINNYIIDASNNNSFDTNNRKLFSPTGLTQLDYSTDYGISMGSAGSPVSGSFLFGYLAGTGGYSASNSIMMGYQAGYSAGQSANAIYLGDFSGYYDYVDNSYSDTSIAIGRYSGTGGNSNSIAIGHGVINSSAYQVNIGNVLYLQNIYASDSQTSTPQSNYVIIGGTYNSLETSGKVKFGGATNWGNNSSAPYPYAEGDIYYDTTTHNWYISLDGSTWTAVVGGGGGGSGDVVGPSSAGDSDFALFDGTTGKLIKDSVLTLDGSGVIKYSGRNVMDGQYRYLYDSAGSTVQLDFDYAGSLFGLGSAQNTGPSPSDSIILGYDAGLGVQNGNMINLGSFAGAYAYYAYNNNFIGSYSGYGATNVTYSNFLGINAGYNATDANYSNLLGSNSGYGATNANDSNFFGNSAGYNASAADHSNFFGNSAGYGATYANNSIFEGESAGSGASSANNAVFLGTNAGFNATSAYNSIFIGDQAGYTSTNSAGSIFLGYYAGYNASSSTYSVFIGPNAAYGATSAYDSNFIGDTAGQYATGAYISNFFGFLSGMNSTNAYDSNFFGQGAGSNSSTANDMIAIGHNAGASDAVDNSGGGTSIVIGNYSGTGGYSDSVTIGHGIINSNSSQMNFGNVLYLEGTYNSNTQSSTPQTNHVVIGGSTYAINSSGAVIFNGASGDLFEIYAGSTKLSSIGHSYFYFNDASGTTSTNFYDRTLVDSAGYVADDWDNRKLYANNGSTVAINYSGSANGAGSIEAGVIAAIGGGTGVLDLPNARLVKYTGMMPETVFDWGAKQIYGDLGWQIDLVNAKIQAAGVYSGAPAIDFSNYNMLDVSGTTSIDWYIRKLKDGFAYDSLDWYNRLLLDTTTHNSVDWTNRKLFATDGSTLALDWNYQTLYGNWNVGNNLQISGDILDGFGNHVIDPINRKLKTAGGYVWTYEDYGNLIGLNAEGNITGQTGALSGLCASITPNDGNNHTYQVGGSITVTAVTAGTVIMKVVYKDQNNATQTQNLFPIGITSASLTATGTYNFSNFNIRTYPNTTITLKTTFAGVSVAYDISGQILRLT